VTGARATPTIVTTTSPSSATPNFLARFERSLSQLNLGGKRKSTAATPTEPISKPVTTPPTPVSSSSSSSTPIPSPSHQKSRVRNSKENNDNPPPLPQRNAPRKSLPTSPISTSQISDLDSSMAPFGSGLASGNGSGAKKKNKNKIKANSDPKMSSELMLQMEASQYPPPLPPRTNFQDDGVFGQIVTNKDSMDGLTSDGRALPNSLATQLNYPLISTSVTVREGLPPPNYHHHHHHSFDGTNSCSIVDGAKVVS
jgi:hypothetical protein